MKIPRLHPSSWSDLRKLCELHGHAEIAQAARHLYRVACEKQRIAARAEAALRKAAQASRDRTP